MTQRDELAAIARAAGLRLGPGDIDLLLPAWVRYRALLEALRESVDEELPE